MFFEESIENCDFVLVHDVFPVSLLDVIRQCATGEGESDDAGDHDQDADDLLVEGRGLEVTVTYRRDGRYSEVEAR